MSEIKKCTIVSKNVRHYGVCTIVNICAKIPIYPYIPFKIEKWMTEHPVVEYDYDYEDKTVLLTVSGKAIQSKNDSYNEKIGVRIAESRAKKHLYKFCNTFYGKMSRYYNDVADTCFRSAFKFRDLYEDECKHYDEVLSYEPY